MFVVPKKETLSKGLRTNRLRFIDFLTSTIKSITEAKETDLLTQHLWRHIPSSQKSPLQKALALLLSNAYKSSVVPGIDVYPNNISVAGGPSSKPYSQKRLQDLCNYLDYTVPDQSRNWISNIISVLVGYHFVKDLRARMIEGNDILTAYRESYGRVSCMSGRPYEERHKCPCDTSTRWFTLRDSPVSLYVENPDTIKMLVLSSPSKENCMRALVWKNEAGFMFLDRMYPDNSRIFMNLMRGCAISFNVGITMNCDITPPYSKPFSIGNFSNGSETDLQRMPIFKAKAPSNERYPYMDTMNLMLSPCEGKSIRANDPIYVTLVDLVTIGKLAPKFKDLWKANFSSGNGPITSFQVCSKCSSSCTGSDISKIDDEWYCTQCAERMHRTKCLCCGKMFKKNGDKRICEICEADGPFVKCWCCGFPHKEKESVAYITEEGETSPTCPTCLKHNSFFTTCEKCKCKYFAPHFDGCPGCEKAAKALQESNAITEPLFVDLEIPPKTRKRKPVDPTAPKKPRKPRAKKVTFVPTPPVTRTFSSTTHEPEETN